MNEVDFDKSKFHADGYGQLTPKAKTYKGFTIDAGIGKVKVWRKDQSFFGDYPDVKTAKNAIDSETNSEPT